MASKKNFKHVYTPESQAEITLNQVGKKKQDETEAKEAAKPGKKSAKTAPKKAEKPEKAAPTLKEMQEKTPDLPEKPTDPGQTALFDKDQRKYDFPIPEERDEQEPDEAKTERKRGSNRRIYDEPTKSTSFKLPLSAIEKLKELSALAGTNTTQYLLKLLNEDYEAKAEELEAIARIRNKIKE